MQNKQLWYRCQKRQAKIQKNTVKKYKMINNL